MQPVPEMLKYGKHTPLGGDDICPVHAQEDVDMQTHIHPHTPRTQAGDSWPASLPYPRAAL